MKALMNEKDDGDASKTDKLETGKDLIEKKATSATDNANTPVTEESPRLEFPISTSAAVNEERENEYYSMLVKQDEQVDDE